MLIIMALTYMYVNKTRKVWFIYRARGYMPIVPWVDILGWGWRFCRGGGGD